MMDIQSVVDVCGIWGVTALFAGVVLLCLMLHDMWNDSKLDRAGIPMAKTLPLIGGWSRMVREGIINVEKEWSKRLGDIYSWRLGRKRFLVVKDPDILKEVLVKDFANFMHRAEINTSAPPFDQNLFISGGEPWRRLRAIMSPTFTAGKMKLMNEDLDRCARLLTKSLVDKAKKGEDVVVKDFFGAFTMDAIASTSFGLEIDSQTNPNDPFVAHAKDLFKPRRRQRWLAVFLSYFPWFSPVIRWLGIGFFSKKTNDFFVSHITAMIKDRRENRNARTDFLELMMKSEADENNFNSTGSKKMNTDEIIAQAVLFFLAGYETTSSLLRFTSHQLALNPEIQQKIYEEIERELGDETPRYDNIQKLHYMEQVLFEVLRLYPPLGRITRETSGDRTIKGVTIPKGTGISIPIMDIHHDERFYPEPEMFIPERFAERSAQSSILFLPFGFGPRICLGMRLALMEAKIAMVHMMRKIKFVKSSKTQVPLKMFPSQGLTIPLTPIVLKVELRD